MTLRQLGQNISESMKGKWLWMALVAAVLLGSLVIAGALRSRGGSSHTIFVYGVGTRDFTSDLIVWQGSYASYQTELKDAYAALERSRQLVEKYITGKGVPVKDLVFSAIDIKREFETTRDRNGSQTSRFTGFRLSQHVTIESHEVDQVETLSRQVTELINQGLEFSSDTPQFFYSKLADLKLEMIAQAADDARRRAEAIAIKSHSRLGKLKSASTDVFQITAKNATDAFTAGGVFDTASKVKTVTIMLRAQYEVR